MSDQDLRSLEQALDARERAVYDAEQALLGQETELESLESRFVRRKSTIANLIGHLREQEENLRRRAAAMGESASELINSNLSGAGIDELSGMEGADEERALLIERREELLSARAALVEDRQTALAQRRGSAEDTHDTFERVKASLFTYEEQLAQALRSLIRTSGEWEALPARASHATAITPFHAITPAQTIPEPAPKPDPTQEVTFVAPATPEVTFVAPAAPEVTEPTAEIAFMSPHSPGEDEATAQRLAAASTTPTSDYPITMEVDLEGADGHAFFRYSEDAPDELPGLFVASEQRLSEGREIAIEMSFASGGNITTRGIISWHQDAGEEGPMGMGIDIIELGPADTQQISTWAASHDMMVV